jgi:CDP-paratose 2-epimerase
MSVPESPSGGPVVITGGSGFIGCNLADSFLADGAEVIVLDNLSRPGVERNLAWLQQRHGNRMTPLVADTRDPLAIAPAFARARAVYHFAAQTAVTTSLDAPTEDFEVNARGTLNVLEAVRATGRPIPVIYSSTNKVYGNLGDLEMVAQGDRYMPADGIAAAYGLSEARPLDFCTPYGCSKGVADQYILDYAKSYGLPTAVLRMSCIYGPHQFGTEDQGWVAHFLIRALSGQTISIYGDGCQVRDILHVSDAVAAYRALLSHIEDVKGQAFNLGGGPENAVSLRELLAEIAALSNHEVRLSRADWRRGDQLYFVADTRKLQKATGWRARMGWRDGVRDLARWLTEDGRVVLPLPEPGRNVA